MRVIHTHAGNDWAAEVDDSGHVTIAIKSSAWPDKPASWLVLANGVWHAKRGIVADAESGGERCDGVPDYVHDVLASLIRERKREKTPQERWSVVREGELACVVLEGASVSIHPFINDWVEDVAGTMVCSVWPDAVDKADLISAAPELRDALVDVIKAYAPKAAETILKEGENALHPSLRRALAALAKAKGTK